MERAPFVLDTMHESHDDGAPLSRRDLGRHRRGNANATTFLFGAFALGDKPFLDFLPEPGFWLTTTHWFSIPSAISVI